MSSTKKNPFWGLSSQLRLKAQYVTKNSDEMTRRTTMALVEALVSGPYGVITPVDTSRARANWRTLFYKADNVLFWPKPQKPGTPEDGAEIALAEARETTSLYSGRRSMWITNNVPYIQMLNHGTSDQAPTGFIENALAAAVATIRRANPLLAKPVRANVEK